MLCHYHIWQFFRTLLSPLPFPVRLLLLPVNLIYFLRLCVPVQPEIHENCLSCSRRIRNLSGTLILDVFATFQVVIACIIKLMTVWFTAPIFTAEVTLLVSVGLGIFMLSPRLVHLTLTFFWVFSPTGVMSTKISADYSTLLFFLSSSVIPLFVTFRSASFVSPFPIPGIILGKFRYR